MSVTEFGTSSVHNQLHWSKTTFKQAITKTFFGKLMGTNKNAPIQRLNELESEAGDTIKYDLQYQMTQWGVEGDNPAEGFEEGLVFAQDSVKVDQRRIQHAFRRMSQQRTIHDMRVAGRDGLSDRWAVIADTIMFAQLAGRTGNGTLAAPADVAAHAGNTLVSPTSDTDHYIDKSTEEFRSNHIELLMEKANTIDTPIQPAKCGVMDGASYLLIVHPINVTDLRIGSTGNQWIEVTKYANMGRSEGNPFFEYVVGKWGDTVILASRYIPVTTGVAHCLFLGAQAGVVAFANAYSKADAGGMNGGMYASWRERVADYGNEKGVSLGTVFGMKPSIFTKPGGTAKRFGMIQIDIKATAHT